MWDLMQTERTVSRVLPAVIVVVLVLLIVLSLGVDAQALQHEFAP